MSSKPDNGQNGDRRWLDNAKPLPLQSKPVAIATRKTEMSDYKLRYEMRQGRTIYRDGKELVAIHRCLTPHNNVNPAGFDQDATDEFVRSLVQLANVLPDIREYLEWCGANDMTDARKLLARLDGVQT